MEEQKSGIEIASNDFSFQGALDYFQHQGGREAETMLRQPLQYLKANQVHKLRILLGFPKPIAWFVPCQRHYMGRPTIAAIRRAGARKSVICPASFSSSACFVDSVRAYLEAVGSSALANELVLSEVAVVNAYRANEAEPQVAPFLITKSNLNQLMDHWREGYTFFHPLQGMAVTFRPLEGTNMFSVTPDPKISAVNPQLLQNVKPLSEVMNQLLIPYETMKSWFVQPLVDNVDHFLATGEARPLDWKALAAAVIAPANQAPSEANMPPMPPPTGSVTPPHYENEIPFTMGADVSTPPVTPPVTPPAASTSFVAGLEQKIKEYEEGATK